MKIQSMPIGGGLCFKGENQKMVGSHNTKVQEENMGNSEDLFRSRFFEIWVHFVAKGWQPGVLLFYNFLSCKHSH